MKNLFLAAAIVISSLAPAQIFAQAYDNTQAINVIVGKFNELAKSHPEFLSGERYEAPSIKVTKEIINGELAEGADPIFSDKVPSGNVIVPFPSDYPLDYKDNSDKVLNSLAKAFSYHNDFGYDYYQLFVIKESDGRLYFVVALDFQNPVTLEGVFKEMNNN